MGVIIILAIGVLGLLLGRDIEEKKWYLFVATIAASTFINVGTAFQIYIIFTYSMVLQVVYLCVALVQRGKHLLLNKRTLISFVLFVLTILSGFFMLIANVHDYQPIIPFSISMDDVYLKLASPKKPAFGYANISAFIILMIFCAFLLNAKKYITDSYWNTRTQNVFIKIFRGFFIFVIFEFMVNNFISSDAIRNIVMSLFGEPTRGYSFSQIRNGFYSTNALFSEPSYIIVSIFYYMFILRKDEKTNVDILWNLVGIIALICSGASSGLVLIPFAILATFWSGKKPSMKILVSYKKTLFFSILLIVSGIIVYSQRDLMSILFQSVIEKLLPYLNSNVTNDFLSGSIRQYGNRIVYNAFFDMPILGYGLGTTRGYGIIPGALATIGILGIMTYCNFIKNACKLKIDFLGAVCLIAFCIYATSLLSVWYIYEPMIILLFIVIRKTESENAVE